MVIENIGNVSVTDAFRVDAYLNPTTPPTAVNQTWDTVGTQGLVWQVDAPTVPLEVGSFFTLTIGGA